jgi:hypothetical protein
MRPKIERLGLFVCKRRAKKRCFRAAAGSGRAGTEKEEKALVIT